MDQFRSILHHFGPILDRLCLSKLDDLRPILNHIMTILDQFSIILGLFCNFRPLWSIFDLFWIILGLFFCIKSSSKTKTNAEIENKCLVNWLLTTLYPPISPKGDYPPLPQFIFNFSHPLLPRPLVKSAIKKLPSSHNSTIGFQD